MRRWMKAIGLSWKVQLAPALLVLALLGIGGFALQALRVNQQSVDALIAGPVRLSEQAGELNNAAWTAHARLYRLAATAANESDESKLAKVSKEASAALGQIPGALADVEKALGTAAAQPPFQKLKSAAASYLKQAKNAIEMADGDAGSAMLFIKSAEKSFAEIDSLISDLIVASNESRDREIARSAIALDRQQWMLGGILLGVCFVGILISVLIGRGIARPVVAMSGAMHELASGNFGVQLPGLERGDEVGRMARAVEEFKLQAVAKAEREHAERERQEHEAAAARRAELHQLADGFESAVGEIIETVGTASRELEHSADALAKGSSATQQLSDVVAAASAETSHNVQSVASAAQQMNASVAEVGRQVGESRSIAAEAVTQAEQTDSRIAKLAQAATRIGDVTQLINTIAEQTNLLALNATIEAARAGDAERGFAVVAQEVKVLAEQTSKATGEISAQINEIQLATRESVVAIKEIGGTIARVAHIASTIAAAVDEQGTATQGISHSVQQAAAGTNQVATSIADVNRGAADTGEASARVLTSAQMLSSESGRLRAEVQKFLATVRVA
ncbi:chemotaxis protein [Rhodopseudomonas sp. AAP120]|uniref:methyl-accepting chemotaxis protein n=1 Tax=Rhodopseudomonas sp. AAP120 TaxID=1523430 RepID=UPI0006B9283D|nr:methyl-accepting chemotaxis protein [Rhodopseudomonas sp. AAP120]KPF90387.1 chemotaxis protein [Rhodopseudomonas sp. AAP120]